MICRYMAEVTQLDAFGHYATQRRRSFKTLGAASRWLDRTLRPFSCSRYTYHRDRRRAQWGDVYDLKAGRKHLLEVEAPCLELPTVADVGVW